MRFWIAEPNQQKKQPFLVEGRADKFSKFALVQRHRWHDYECVASVVAGGQGAPDLSKTWLQQLERGKLLVKREVAGKRRLGDHANS